MASMCCVVYGPDGKCYSGSTEGSVYVWDGKNCSRSIVVGVGMINAITVAKDRIVVGTGSSIITFNSNFSKISEVDVRAPVRAIDINNDTILAGLRDGSIIETNGKETQVLMQSHSDGEVWGLDIDPSGRVIIICKLSNTFRLLLVLMITRLWSGILKLDDVSTLQLSMKLLGQNPRQEELPLWQSSHLTNVLELLL